MPHFRYWLVEKLIILSVLFAFSYKRISNSASFLFEGFFMFLTGLNFVPVFVMVVHKRPV